MKKYGPLENYLSGLPASKIEVTLKFSEIEEILKAKLPRSSSLYPEWWANQQYGSQAPAWLGAGFVVDSVNTNRKIVQFRRDYEAKTIKKRRIRVTRQRERIRIIEAKELLKAGFEKYGSWQLEEDGRICLVGDIPKDPGVYAHVVNGKVYYIGSATMGLKKRLYSYSKPGSTQRTSIRINALIAEELKAGNIVELIAARPDPSSWNSMPVDLVSGLEAGLIKSYAPPWNKRGVVSGR